MHVAFLSHFGFLCILGATAGDYWSFALAGRVLAILDFVRLVRWSFPMLAAPQDHYYVNKDLLK